MLSHLHTDHIGNVAAFGQAEVVVTRVEWERAQGFRGHLHGYIPHRWPTGVRPRTVDFDGPAIGTFPSSYDLAGDGRWSWSRFPAIRPDTWECSCEETA